MIAAHPGGGRIGKRFYVITAVPTETADRRAGATASHLEWLEALDKAGQLLLAGPFVVENGVSTGGGMFIIRAASQAEAERIAATDPYNAGGYRRFTVAPWRLDQASAALVPLLSAQD